MSEQALIWNAALICPRIGSTIVWIIIAGYTNFIAVIDSGSTRNSELYEGGDTLAPLPFRHIRCIELFLGSCLLPRSQRPKNTLGIVAIQQVHQGVVGSIRIILANRLQPGCEFGGE